MGRNRSFDESEVVHRAADAFLRRDFEGTSIDDLVRITGLHRGSLYQAFASKRGLFLTVLRQVLPEGLDSIRAVDLLLIAALELAVHDKEVREIIRAATDCHGGRDPAVLLGRRLLQRAGLE